MIYTITKTYIPFIHETSIENRSVTKTIEEIRQFSMVWTIGNISNEKKIIKENNMC